VESMPLVLCVVEGADTAEIDVIPGSVIKIGRAVGSDLRIAQPSVSSNHAVVLNGELEDVGSTNGTVVNNQQLSKGSRHLLRAGDKVVLGEVVVKVVLRGYRKGSVDGSDKPPIANPVKHSPPQYAHKNVKASIKSGAAANRAGGSRASVNRGGAGGSKGGSKGGGRIPVARGSALSYDTLLPPTLITNTGQSVHTSHLYEKIVGLYFAAGWSGNCTRYTPTLIRIYKELAAKNKPFEVVLVSSDHQITQFRRQFSDMPWLAVPYQDRARKDNLREYFDVNSSKLPTLVLLDEEGKIITAKGRMILTKLGSGGYPYKTGADFALPSNIHNDDGDRGSKVEDFMRSKRFPGAPLMDEDEDQEEKKEEDDEDADLDVAEWMEKQFNKIIGHDQLKAQLRQFHKKVQLDVIRQEAGGAKEKKRLYHMLFMGPPGTGKTTMANLVSKIMVKMKLIETDNVVFVDNALDLIVGYVGQTPAKVDDTVFEAKGGVLFIDEAYSIVKSSASQKDSFGKEAIETIMKHLDPPTCVFIFAGYQKEMDEFLKVNPGLARRIPYRYTFEAYSDEQLFDIFKVMCQAKSEDVAEDLVQGFPGLIGSIEQEQKLTQNAGLINNWISFAQMERDDRITIEEAQANPDLASLLVLADFQNCTDKINSMKNDSDGA